MSNLLQFLVFFDTLKWIHSILKKINKNYLKKCRFFLNLQKFFSNGSGTPFST